MNPILIAIGLLIAAGCATMLRIFSGMKNGAFYAKGMHPGTKAQPYVDNMHLIEAPQWYVQFATFFIPVLLVALSQMKTNGHGIMYSVGAAFLIGYGASSAASYWYQAWINRGSGLPDVDPNENHKAEFAIRVFGKNYSYWWSRPWYGKRRIWSQYLGIAEILTGIAMICFL